MIYRLSNTVEKELFEKSMKEKLSYSYHSDFNINVGGLCPIICSDNKNQIIPSQWGLIPFDSHDPSVGKKLKVARTETIFAKTPFATLITKNRCIVIVDGVTVSKDGQSTHRLIHQEKKLFALAGIYAKWHDEYDENKHFCSFSLLTKESDQSLQEITERVPVIITDTNKETWLEPELSEGQIKKIYLEPYNGLDSYELGSGILKINKNDARAVRPINSINPGETFQMF